jgi:hypothetical protein
MSEIPKKQRAFRATDETWGYVVEQAEEAGVTVNEWLEDLIDGRRTGKLIEVIERAPVVPSEGRCRATFCDNPAVGSTGVCSRHTARPGVRIARICTQCNTRRFGDPNWRCEEHPNKTVNQANVPYLGQPT